MAFSRIFKPNIKKLKESRDIPSLVEALSVEDAGVRTGAAAALIELGNEGIDALAVWIESSDPPAVQTVLSVLAAEDMLAGSPLVTLILRVQPEIQTIIARELAVIGKPDYSALIAAARDSLPEHRLCAAILLPYRGYGGVDPLRSLLRDPDGSVAAVAAQGLKMMEWKGEDPRELVTYHILLNEWPELMKYKQYAIFPLLSAMRNPRHAVRSEAVKALGKMRNINTLPEITTLLSDPEPDVRSSAIGALGEIGDPRVIPLVLEALYDPVPSVRIEAAWTLDRLGWEPTSDIERVRYLIAREQWNDIIKMGKIALPVLIGALREKQSGVRIGAVEALMKIGRQGQDALAAAAGSQDPELRTAVRSAMKEINQRKAEEEKRKRAAADDSKYQREMKDSQDARERFVEKHGPPRPLPPELPKPAERVPERKDIDGLSPARIMKMGQADLSKVPVQDTGAGRKEKAPPVDAKRLEEINRAIAEFHKATGLTPGEVPRGAGAGKEAKKEKPKSPATEENLPDEGPEKMYSGLGAPGGTLPSRISRSSLKDAVRKQTQTLDEAIQALKNPDPVIRAAAIEALRVFGDTGREEIKKALSDADPGVRETAADALGEIGDEFCVPLLVALIRDSEGGVRIAAIKALGKLGDLRVIPYLINCFSDEYHVVRHVAADTLVQMGEEAIPALILCLDDELPIKCMTAVRALGKFRHPGVIAPLIRKIGDPDPEMRRAVAQALGTIGEPAIDPLEMVLHAGTKYERLGALDALGYIIADRVKEVIEQALKDPDMEVRFRAEQVLKKRDTLRLWSRAWAEQLQKETERAKPPVAPEAEKPVPPPPDEKTEVTQLINSLRSDDRQTQISSAFKLMVLGRPAVEGLLNALKSEDPQIHALASEVIGEMRDVAVDPLMDALNDKTRLVRLVAARNLGRIGNVRALDALTESLARETDPGVRATVAEALGYMGDKQAIAQLSRAMRDRDEQVQIAAARSLGYIGGIRAIGPLIQALNDVDEYIRRAALIALRDPEGHVQEHLVVALRKGDRSFVQGVADALDRTGWSPKDPLDHAYYLIAKEHWGELEQIGPVALRPLREMLDDPDTEVRIEVVKTIARIGGPETIPLLLHALRDQHFMIRRRAEQALVDMGELVREALSPLKSLDNPEYERIIRKIEARKVKRSGEPEYESGN